MNNQPVPYVDGYVFYAKRSSWMNVCRLWQRGVIRFAAKNLTGPDAIVAFIGEDAGPNAVANRRDKMTQAQAAANPSFTSATSTLLTTSAPSRWSQKPPYAAHLRITATAGMGQFIYDAFDPNGNRPVFRKGQGYNGHALCDGDWDMLLELGAATPQDLDALVAVARAVPNIASVIVTTTEMPAGPEPPETCEPWLDQPNPG
jgi:hypothetical protein